MSDQDKKDQEKSDLDKQSQITNSQEKRAQDNSHQEIQYALESAVGSDENDPMGKVVALVGLAILTGLAILFTTLGADPSGLFELAEQISPFSEATIVPTKSPGRAGDWWEVYFTDPARINDPTDLKGSIPEELIRLINQAKNSIDIAAFEFNLPQVADALVAASQRGVSVRWMTDDEFGIADDEDELGLFELMEDKGVEVRDDDREELMHNKFIVFDNQIVWTGSTNLTTNGSFRNNNNVIVVDSPSLAADYTREFDEMWRGEFGFRAPSTESRQSMILEGTHIQVYFAAEDHPVSSIVPLIEAAEDNVRFMAFSFTHNDLGAAMVDRHEEGVDVKGIFETRGSDSSFSELTRLTCAGVPARQDGNRAILHHKVIVIDDHIVITGSANFSNNADRFNDENLLVIDNVDIAKRYLLEFKSRWAEATDPVRADYDC